MVLNTFKIQSFDELLNQIENETNNENFDDYEEDASPSPVKDVDDHLIFREFIRKGDNFEAYEKFYKMNMETFDLVNINDCEDKIFFSKENNSFFYKESCFIQNSDSKNQEFDLQYENKKFLDIYIFKDMFLDSNELKISKQDLIIRLSLNNIELEPKFIKDLYLDIYHKIHIKDSPLLNQQTMNKKYLFPVNIYEVSSPDQISLE